MTHTVEDWARDHHLRVEILDGPHVRTDPTGWEHRAYVVRLHLPGARIESPWRAGMAVTGGPDAAEILDSLVLDARAGGEDFEGFCGEFGYDTDSRAAWSTWEACTRLRVGLAEFLGGEEFERFMSGEIEGM
jgi:hypothetical protein